MFKNYLTVALRNLLRKKLYTFINIFGLALGLACCILMTLFTKHEWSFDRFHENHEQIFRVTTQRLQANNEPALLSTFDATQPLWIVDVLKAEFPNILHVSAFMQDGRVYAANEDKTFRQTVGLVSHDFLTMFTFPLLVGDPTTAFERPDGAVITETVVHKFFDIDQDYNKLIGQTITLRDKPFTITGILKDVPTASSLQFDILIHTNAMRGFRLSGSNNHRYASVYIQSTTDSKLLQETLNHWKGKERLSEIRYRAQRPFQLILQPMADVYWHTDMPNIYQPQADPNTLYILCGFAGLILLIACSNFITLSVSESSERALEVGLRKVLGANRIQIVRQFWSQALILSFLGLISGLVLVELLLPIFNGFVQRNLQIVYSEDSVFLLIFFIVVGLTAGSYPALVMSRFQPATAIKGEIRVGGRNRLTRALIIFQYTISIALFICTGVMLRQQSFVQNKDLGFKKDEVILIQGGASWDVVRRFKQEALKDPSVASITLSDFNFMGGFPGNDFKLPSGMPLPGGKDWVVTLGVDVDYLSTFEIPLLQGRNFSPTLSSDQTNAVLINQTMAKLLNLENPVGEKLLGFSGAKLKNPTIIGVVGDTHLRSLHEPIEPQVIQINHFNNGYFTFVRINSDNIVETVNRLKEVWNKVSPDIPIQFGSEYRSKYAVLSFLDDIINRQYANDRYWNRVLNYSALLTIILSCLGLFGLASLSVSRRTKEVGIRKVLGASMRDVMWLLSKDFVKLLLVANIIAWPIAYWAMNKWLTNFAYHIELGLSVFILAGLLTLVIALLTINAQTLKAARSNPVDALRYE